MQQILTKYTNIFNKDNLYKTMIIKNWRCDIEIFINDECSIEYTIFNNKRLVDGGIFDFDDVSHLTFKDFFDYCDIVDFDDDFTVLDDEDYDDYMEDMEM